ncbi:MAG: hypothetical protein DMF83_00475 [Acidobacteria bacterium]|nr:MAG: hypothetical protein DMF83_00475 [Acidobacteriota bacterium]
MSHPSEDDLILHYYGEDAASPAVEAHLASCAACSQAFAALRADLSSVTEGPIPARGEEHGEKVWRDLQPRLRLRPAARRMPAVRWWAPAALAASLLAAFLVGRHFPAGGLAPVPIPEQARDRIFLVMVGDHLERSEMVLLEVANAEGKEPVDVRSAQESAENLVAANRLFRLSARRAGEPGVASVLDELERVLLEVAHGPSTQGPEAREQLRKRLESGDILFKVRVLESKVRNKEKQMAAVPATTS